MARPNLLLVDDDARSLRVMEVSLRNAGFEVSTATDGAEAFARVETATPALILCDTHMPEVDGYAFCAQVKADERFKHIPFIFLTDRGATEDKVKALELGVDDYLTKPIYIKEVITRVQLVLQKHERSSLATQEKKRFYGSLETMGVVDLLQTLELGGRSGVLSFEHEVKPARLWFVDGRIVDAEAGRLEGAEAVYRMLTWERGAFEIDFSEVDREATIDDPTQSLVLEGMRRVDEWGRMLEQLPSIQTVFHVDYAELAERLADLPPAVNDLVRLFDGRRTALQVIFDGQLPDLDALSAICQLYFEGVIYEADAADGGPSLGVSRTDAPALEGPVLDAPLGPVEGPSEVKGLVDDLLTAARTPAPDPTGARAHADTLLAMTPPPRAPAPMPAHQTPAPTLPTPAPQSVLARTATPPPMPEGEDEGFMALDALAQEAESTSLPSPGDDVATVRNALNASFMADDTPAPQAAAPTSPPPVPTEAGLAPEGSRVVDHAHEQDFFDSPVPDDEEEFIFDEGPKAPMPRSAWVAITLFGGALVGGLVFFLARDTVEPQTVNAEAVHMSWHSSALRARELPKAVAAIDADWRVFPEAAASAPTEAPVDAIAESPEESPEQPAEQPTVAEAPEEKPEPVAEAPTEQPEAPAEDPPESANNKEFAKLLRSGKAALKREKFKEAVNLLDKALDLNPKHAGALLYYTQAAFEEGMFRESLQASNKLVKIQPKNADAWMYKGIAHQEFNQQGKAVKAYEQYLALKPNGPHAQELKSIINRAKVQ